MMPTLSSAREPVSRSEWLQVIVITAVLVLLLHLPYQLGYFAPADTEFTGLAVNIEDGSYLAAIEMGRQGLWTYQIRFTSEPHDPVYLYEFYVGAGQAARLLNLDTPTMWHLSRSVMNVFMFLTVFGFIAFYLPTAAQRRAAFLLAALGSGFDLTLLPWETLDRLSAAPLDIRMPEAHLFFSALTYAHYGAAVGGLTLLFWSGLRLLTESLALTKQIALMVLAALCNLILLIVHPFLIFLTLLVLGLFWLYRAVSARRILWRDGIVLLMIYIPSLPFLLYYRDVLANNTVIAIWNAQAVTLSPSPLHYLLAYAPYLLLAGWGVAKMRGALDAQPSRVLLWLWVLAVALLLYAPIGAQRRFVEGLQVPLAILATLALFEVALPRVERARWFQALASRPNYSIRGMQNLLVLLLVLFLALPNLYLYVSSLLQLGVVQPYPLFRPRTEIEAMEWLHENAHRDDLVLSSYFTGSYLPFRADTRTYIGQRYETIDFENKLQTVEHFFSTMSDAERRAFLQQNHAAYVFYGSAERALGQFDPNSAPYLVPVWNNAQVTLFRVGTP